MTPPIEQIYQRFSLIRLRQYFFLVVAMNSRAAAGESIFSNTDQRVNASIAVMQHWQEVPANSLFQSQAAEMQ
jgi:demethoxyubiquinone hydroxylase (CLK1/Coq7/Cat5 family)